MAVRITDLLANSDTALGSTAEINGWIRTRRDSKAGLSFLQVSDGSCFDSIQVVAPSELPNYEDGVLSAKSRIWNDKSLNLGSQKAKVYELSDT